MLKKNKNRLIFTSVVTLLPILAGLILWRKLPDTLATHFDSTGTPNGWSSKYFTVFGLPLFILGCHLLCVFGTMNDPKKARISDKMFTIVMWICPVVSIFCGVVLYGYALGTNINTANVASILVGIIFIVVGNYLPKCKQNYTVGIKLPWTLHDEDNWNKTHRLGGWCFIIAGILMIMNIFIKITYLSLGLILAVVLIPTIYSFILYRKSTHE